jgi:AcrR family transcriptional regulator
VSRTHDLLIEVAEDLVRNEGLGALTTRALAARANYGKSTVHEAVGGTAQLVKKLRARASREMMVAAIGDTEPDVTDEAWRAAMARRLSAWIIANPYWAEVCFTPTGAAESIRWTHPMAEIFTGALPRGIADLEPSDSAELSLLASRTISGLVPTIIAVRDVTFGAHLLRNAFTLIRSTIEGLLAVRGLDTTPRPS